MMDVLHFLFEEDFTATSEDHARSRSAIRVELYTDMYGVPYNFKMKDQPRGRSGASNEFQYPDDPDDFSSLDKVEPFSAKKNDPFSPRADKPKRKIDFVDASSVPLVEQSFEGLDAPLN